MNREIKFRAMRADNGEWVYGDLEHNPAKEIIRIHTYDTEGNYEGQHIVTPESVCQFTGLRDNNGQEIYEGDILGCPKDNYFLPETIIFREGCFIAKDDCIDTAKNSHTNSTTNDSTRIAIPNRGAKADAPRILETQPGKRGVLPKDAPTP